MKNYTDTLKWATDCLVFRGYTLQNSPEIVVQAPWSIVTRISTSAEDVYLKQTPPLLFLEPKIMHLLIHLMQESVPIVIGSNDDLCCFLMKDAGLPLRSYLKSTFQPELLGQAISQFTTIQRTTENHLDSFFELGVPDWRLNQFPNLYQQLISQADFLKSEGLNDRELQILHDLIPTLSKQCEKISSYQIQETLVQPDFNTNNMLLNSNTNKMTCIDLGEIVITHPFFSLHNFIIQAARHHGVKEGSPIYHQLLQACCENWLNIAAQNQLLEVYSLVKEIWPIYCAFGFYRLMMSVDAKTLKSYYANKPNCLDGYLREYIAQN